MHQLILFFKSIEFFSKTNKENICTENFIDDIKAMGPKITYTINAHDIITEVNESWDTFAKDNHGAFLNAANVINKSLWELINDIETKHIYKMLLNKVRNPNEANIIEFPFRCDSPSTRRHMHMRLVRISDTHIQFQSSIVREEERERPIPSNTHIDHNDFLRICSWCKKVNDNEQWMEIDNYMNRKKLFDSSLIPKTTHGICDNCKSEMLGLSSKNSVN